MSIVPLDATLLIHLMGIEQSTLSMCLYYTLLVRYEASRNSAIYHLHQYNISLFSINILKMYSKFSVNANQYHTLPNFIKSIPSHLFLLFIHTDHLSPSD